MKEYLSLLVRRESRDVLGRKWINLWLLMTMLLAMFLAIAFSNGSMEYLAVKMDDPFTNWVNISNAYGSDRFDEFVDALDRPEIQEHFMFGDVQTDRVNTNNFKARNGDKFVFDIRFFERPDSKIFKAILDESNVVGGAVIPYQKLADKSYGFILTRDALGKLGYDEDSIPAYINFGSYAPNADPAFVEIDNDGMVAVPVPVLAVVKRLPDNKDMISARYFAEQYTADRHPLSLANISYLRSLTFFVPSEVSEETFFSIVRESVPDSIIDAYQIFPDKIESLATWKPGRIYSVYIDNENLMPTELFADIASSIAHAGTKHGLVRLYNYEECYHRLPEEHLLSITFQSLDSIRSFENFAFQNYGVKIDMAQINTKENFNEVSVLAGVLSWVMIVFSIVSIVIFIVNMLQSYFKKISRNLGTFKAFGIDSAELVWAYEGLLVCIVGAAVAGAVAIVWIIQLILPMIGVLKNGYYNYLNLWTVQTFLAAAIVMIAAVVTVAVVMRGMLRRTPGSLIYDR